MNYSFFFKLFSRIFRIFFNFKNDDIKLTELNKLFYLGGFDFVATSVNDFNLITRQNSDFILKKTFQDSIKFAEKITNQKRSSEWIFNSFLWSSETGLRIDGDFVELGVERGYLTLAMLKYIGVKKFKNRSIYLLDSWEGVDQETLLPGEEEMDINWNKQFEGNYEFIKKTFKKYSFVKIIKGFIPETLPKIDSNKISFLHIDLNSAFPEAEAIKFLWNKIVPGGIILLDDYNQVSREVQKDTINKLSKTIGFSVLSLPTGQGLIIK